MDNDSTFRYGHPFAQPFCRFLALAGSRGLGSSGTENPVKHPRSLGIHYAAQAVVRFAAELVAQTIICATDSAAKGTATWHVTHSPASGVSYVNATRAA